MTVSTSYCFNILFRFLQVASSAVAAGLLSEYVSIVNHTALPLGSRIVYALSMACISLGFALFVWIPSSKFHYSFPFDFCMGLLLVVAASLLLAVGLLESAKHRFGSPIAFG